MKLAGRTPHIPLSAASEFHLPSLPRSRDAGAPKQIGNVSNYSRTPASLECLRACAHAARRTYGPGHPDGAWRGIAETTRNTVPLARPTYKTTATIRPWIRLVPRGSSTGSLARAPHTQSSTAGRIRISVCVANVGRVYQLRRPRIIRGSAPGRGKDGRVRTPNVHPPAARRPTAVVRWCVARTRGRQTARSETAVRACSARATRVGRNTSPPHARACRKMPSG